MKMKQLSLPGAFIALGLAVPGCFLFANHDNDAQFCASPVEGGEYCVSTTNYTPSDAWANAKAAGTEPIQMWAVWPKNVELDDVVTNPKLLNAWLGDVQTVLDYLRITQANAESYQASLSGKLGDDLSRARNKQISIIADKSVNAKSLLVKPLLEKAAQETDPLKAEVAADKQIMGDVQAIFDQATTDAAPFSSQYKTLIDDFVTYRATESAETDTYTTLTNDASNATLVELDTIELSILDAAQTASKKPNELLVTGMKLSAQILQFENDSRTALSPHADFMNANGTPMPDMSSGALRSIHAMLGYSQQRVARSDATAKSILLGVGMRRRALQLLANAPSPLRTTIANAMLAKASTTFANTSQVRVNALATTLMSSNLQLPYLAQRYDESAAFLQMAPLCNTISANWRESGCASMRPKFKDAANDLKVALPAQITQDLAILKTKGVDPVAIDKVQEKLNAGDIKGAALAHDVLLRSTEGT